MTGKYDMRMLTRLGKLEEEFRTFLADVWGVGDEDGLPDSLQELDFNDIMASGETPELRSNYLVEQLVKAEGYDASKKDRVDEAVQRTIQAIQKLEEDFVKIS
eukprot:CAMPEP_0172599058 /NCGR_PEP_ID=MMETSP1068-20121228/19156_1 /TAXON_ID=35684 /ORGANISM="Pseudopedinella elastica, Strain CCMP716" /LENGTH=102 /DNA_ID=CAMNT_0013399191 /DNA_START=164 /DNA_END=472 /DNA_ORIENTATION=-